MQMSQNHARYHMKWMDEGNSKQYSNWTRAKHSTLHQTFCWMKLSWKIMGVDTVELTRMATGLIWLGADGDVRLELNEFVWGWHWVFRAHISRLWSLQNVCWGGEKQHVVERSAASASGQLPGYRLGHYTLSYNCVWPRAKIFRKSSLYLSPLRGFDSSPVINPGGWRSCNRAATEWDPVYEEWGTY